MPPGKCSNYKVESKFVKEVVECEIYSLATSLDPRYKKELCVGVRKVQGHQKESC